MQTTLTDGSINDGDNNDVAAEDGEGDVNGLVALTLAVGKTNIAVVDNGRIETGLRGGGSHSWLFLLALASLLALAKASRTIAGRAKATMM